VTIQAVITALGSYLQSGARTLLRNRGFTLTVLATLALGIGGISALFSVVDKVLLEPLPYADPDRLVQLITTSQVGEQYLSSIPQFMLWRDTTTSFESMAASDTDGPDVSFTGGSYRAALRAGRVSADYFQVLGAKFAIGRSFSAHEDEPGGRKAAVVSDAMWRRFLGPNFPVGRTILLDDVPYQVVGVLDADAHLEVPADVWLPLDANRVRNDHIGRVRVIARLKPSVSLKEAQKDVGNTLRAFFQQNRPGSKNGPPVLFGEEFSAIPLRYAVVGDVRHAFYILMIAGVFLLAISCVNTITLFLTRATLRTREMAIRLAIGAYPRQISLQLLTEAVLLSLAGGLLSLVLGQVAVRVLLGLSPAELPRIGANGSALALDWKVFLFTVLVSVFLGVLCGLAPAITAARTNINVLVKDNASQSGMGLRHNRWRSHLMIVQVALSLMLLAGAGTMIRTFVAQRTLNHGFEQDNVFTLEMSLSNPRFEKTAQLAQLVREVEHEMKGVRGMEAIATTSGLPLVAGLPLPFTIIKNEHSLLGNYDGTVTWRGVSPQYFKVFQIPLLEGRMFTPEDDENSPGVVLISRAMAKRYWQAVGSNPVGEFITVADGLRPGYPDVPKQIVGVVADVRDTGLEGEASLYVPVAQVSDWLNERNNLVRPIVWAVRTDGTGTAPLAAVQQKLASLSGGQPLGQPRAMRETIAAFSARTQFYVILLAVFAGLALVLTAMGIYGLITYAVEQRSGELAIRSALGASPGKIKYMVVTQALRLTLLGAAIGVPSSLAVGRVMISLIFGIQSWHFVVLPLVTLLLCLVALIAAYIPSVRASHVNPATALRA
jgi:putative ABC transport system permease protein